MNKSLKFSYGLAQIPLMIILLLMAIAVPVATKLVQQNQDTRNQAAGACVSAGGSVGLGMSCCPGLNRTNCKGSGSFYSCTCSAAAASTPKPDKYQGCACGADGNYWGSTCDFVGTSCVKPTAKPTVQPPYICCANYTSSAFEHDNVWASGKCPSNRYEVADVDCTMGSGLPKPTLIPSPTTVLVRCSQMVVIMRVK